MRQKNLKNTYRQSVPFLRNCTKVRTTCYRFYIKIWQIIIISAKNGELIKEIFKRNQSMS